MSENYIHLNRQASWSKESKGILIQGKLPEAASRLAECWAGKVQMIYLDPPFNTGKHFEVKVRVGDKGYRTGSPVMTLPAYDDRWISRDAYLSFMREILLCCKKLLKKNGTIFLHTDYRMNAYLRLLMDEVFGESNFLNEIIWSYQSGGRARNFFPRKHDMILLYSNSKEYYFNLKGVPVERSEARSNHMRRGTDEEGRNYRAIVSAGKEYRYYDDEPAYPGDVWDDISHLQQKDPQRTGYDTQKPLSLMERIIRCSTQEGDLVCDLFAGSGTTADAAARLGRKFISMDANPLSAALTVKRLMRAKKPNDAEMDFEVEAEPAPDDCEAECEVIPAISSYTVCLLRYESPAAKEAGIEGLNAVDSWYAGFVRNGEFRGCVAGVRSKATPALATTLEMPVMNGDPCVLIVDIWGGRRYYLPKRRY